MTAAVLHIPRLATVEHVADLLGLHPRTVRDLYTDGTLTVYRVGPKGRSGRQIPPASRVHPLRAGHRDRADP